MYEELLSFFTHTIYVVTWILLSQTPLVIAEVRCAKWTFYLNAAQSSDVIWKIVVFGISFVGAFAHYKYLFHLSFF